MKSLNLILSILIFITLLVSCSPEKVSVDQIRFNDETNKAELNGESFSGIGVREIRSRRRGNNKIRHYYYEDGVLVKKIQGESKDGTWEMGEIQWENEVKSKEVDGKIIYE